MKTRPPELWPGSQRVRSQRQCGRGPLSRQPGPPNRWGNGDLRSYKFRGSTLRPEAWPCLRTDPQVCTVPCKSPKWNHLWPEPGPCIENLFRRLFPSRKRSPRKSCAAMCPPTTSIWSRAPRTVPRFTSSCVEGWARVLLAKSQRKRRAEGVTLDADQLPTLPEPPPSPPWQATCLFPSQNAPSLHSPVFTVLLRDFSLCYFPTTDCWGNLPL